jgi:hypothetical protein
LVTPSLLCFHIFKALHPTTKQPRLAAIYTFSFRLQPTSGFFECSYRAGNSRTPLVWSLSALQPEPRDEQVFQTCRSPPRISHPFGRFCDSAGPRVYSTPQALLGSRPPEPDIETIVLSSSERHTPTLLPSLHGFLPGLDQHSRLPSAIADYPYLRPYRDTAPDLLTETGFHLGIGPTLKLYSRFNASPIAH